MDYLTRGARCRTILLVEDTLDDEQLVLRSLGRVSFPILTKIARDGAQALDVLQLEYLPEERTCARPDLVICDIKLPKLTGDEVLRHVRCDPALKTVPFVMFSSSDEASDVERCRNHGCDGYVVKPVDYRRFTQAVQSIVEHYLFRNAEAARPPEAVLWA
ncbi:response regulator [bacterium]|nr:MAG: response regulator [bacterium]